MSNHGDFNRFNVNRDRIKNKLFSEAGWRVLTYEDRHYTPESAFKDVVANIGIEPIHNGV